MNTTGRNTSTVVMVEANTAGHTLRMPSTEARNRSSPLRRSISMLSSTTMELSSVMPMANATPAREITLMVRPASNRPRKAAMVQIGMPTTPTAVTRTERRNRNITRVAKAAPIARLVQTLATEAST